MYIIIYMKRNKNISLIALIGGYLLGGIFCLLLISNLSTRDKVTMIAPMVEVVEINNTIVQEKIVYVDRDIHSGNVDNIPPVFHLNTHRVDHDMYTIRDGYRREYVEPDVTGDITYGTSDVSSRGYNTRRRDINHKNREVEELVDHDVDFGLLDRRIKDTKNKSTVNSQDDIGNLTPDASDDQELGNIKPIFKKGATGSPGGGQLYAYSFPSNGIGAGVGSGALGAGGGLGAGLSAGVGQGVTGGETVPTLGGVGSYATAGPGGPGSGLGAPGSGTGGLANGAGAGAAAGLMTGKVIAALGIAAPGTGSGGDNEYNYDHLPEDGALHIMMHVDGSGSILNTRKQLEMMRDTLLKDALLPYYNNDEDLYNQRVTIVSSSGERTLRFFEEAAKKDNVLAIAFQDEAQPAYHLPNFNKQPEVFYLDDLNNLKASLNGYRGVYRGVMFQVDRGRTFAKSFKEFVGNAFKGEGYLDSDNLKKYYRDNNTDNIKNKDGIVFSDEYHAKDSGDPQYYLELILNASQQIGLDLRSHGGGLVDGKARQ